MRGQHERPLRITFHSSWLAYLPQEEQEALQALVELSHLPEIVTLQSAPGEFPSFDIGAANVEADYIPVIVKTINETRATGIFHPVQWKEFA